MVRRVTDPAGRSPMAESRPSIVGICPARVSSTRAGAGNIVDARRPASSGCRTAGTAGITGTALAFSSGVVGVPSSRWLLSPQQRIVPSARSAQECADPTDISVAAAIPRSVDGDAIVQSPQHETRPATSSAQVWYTPAEIATAPVTPATTSGMRENGGRRPSPPGAAAPQHRTVPSCSSAQAWLSPTATDTAPVSPATVTGTGDDTSELLPSAPDSLYPQQRAVVSLSTAQARKPPADSDVTPLSPATTTGSPGGALGPGPSPS